MKKSLPIKPLTRGLGFHNFKGNKLGKTVTIFSGIHGDEISGIKATKRFISEIEKGNIEIKSGELIIVPECNEKAIEIGKREVKYNLNRLFYNSRKGESYEENRSEKLMKILDKTDYMLDLHSTSESSDPFLFCEDNTIDIAKSFGASNIVYGWKNLDSEISSDTQTYVCNKGGVGFTFEAGSHLDSEAEKNAYNMILNFLSVLGVIEHKNTVNILESNVYEIYDVYINKSGNFKYTVNVENFTRIKKGQIIGYDGKEKIVAKNDMIFIMPKSEDIIKKGIEVFFYGKLC